MNDMSDREKSVLLAKAMRWYVTVHDKRCAISSLGERLGVTDYPLNLYDPENMALAWRVLNHFSWVDIALKIVLQDTVKNSIHDDPADAQRLWLDKVLELAIEIGIITLEAEPDRPHR